MRIVRPGNAASIDRMLQTVANADPTYVGQGAILTGELPDNFHHLAESTKLGHGARTFAHASEGLRTWRAHRLTGMRVFPEGAPLQVGTTVVVTVGISFAAIAAPCRILAVIDEPSRFGFVYGTLPGHPEQGEEAFVVTIGEDEDVQFKVTAFSRPVDPLTRVIGPLGRTIQSAATSGYLRAMRKLVAQAAQF